MNPILVYSPQEAVRNAFVVEKMKSELGAKLVSPSYRGEADFVINRSNDFEIAQFYEAQGVRVFNPAFFSKIANDKQLCYDYMQKNGIEIMPTRYSTPPFVKKPKNSHGGQGVVMCNSESEYDENMVCQKAASDFGRDVRLWVLGGKIECAILRISDTDFRSNYCLGGRAQIYNLSADEIRQAEKIISLVNGDYYGIDFVFNHGNAVFNELEDAVGARMVYDLTDIDIIGKYIRYIKAQMNI